MNKNKHYDVGLVGWWFASNYGSSLTYYALGSVLKDMGKEVLMIPIAKSDGTPWEKETDQTVQFISRYFQVGPEHDFDEMHEYNACCDMFMLGSDQMWAPSYLNLVGYTFFLDFVEKNRKKIAFSTSFGQSDFIASEEICATASDYLKRFSAISVREKNGIDICRNRFGVEVQQVFDPVFLCPREKYDLLTQTVSSPLPEKYLLCYILDPSPEKEEAAKAIAERNGLEIITILGMKEYNRAIGQWHTGKVLPRITSEQFLYYIKNCDFLLTDSHHGTCYGIIYHKQYAALVNASRGKTRFETVANALQLSDRIFADPKDIINSENIFKPIDYRMVDTLLNKEKAESFVWLKNALAKPAVQAEVTVRTVAADMERKLRAADIRLHRCKREYAEIRVKQQGDPAKNVEALHANPEFIKIRLLATLLRDYGVKHIVLSPGGRDVPLVRMFEYNEDQFILHRITDERSAAYFGLGIAVQLQQPVVCICTSGTAASNYLPAVTEAYYTGVPLIVVTADRREVYLNHGEDQTIPQKNIYDGVIRKEVTIPEAADYLAEYQTRRDISECILESTHNGFGPVHINIAIQNISIGASIPKEHWKLLPRISQHLLRVGVSDGEAQMMKWVNALKNSNRILLVYGQNVHPTAKQRLYIEKFASRYNCVIVTDTISNLDCAYSLKPFNMLTAITQKEFNEQLSPDILISVGGKRLMNDPLTHKVRAGYKNIRHWSVAPDGKVKDFYFRLTSVIEASQDYFFEWFANHAEGCINNGVYYNTWRQMSDRYTVPAINTFDSHYIQSRFIPSIPANSMLHLGVGQSFFFPRRYPIDKSVEVFCNMGTNGIDGCTSTFMGQCAVVKDKLCFLLVGDLSFFYDMNSIWNKQLHKNIRILLVNNNGTGLLRGHNLKGIASVHNTEAKNWVESTGFDYISARTKEEYEEKLRYFVSGEPPKALFFEVFCD